MERLSPRLLALSLLGALACCPAMAGCLVWLAEVDDPSGDQPSEPPSLESRARSMLERPVYIPFSEDRNQWVLRRCSHSGEQHRCDLVFVRAGAVTRTMAAYHPSQRFTRADHHQRAEELAEVLEDLDLDEDYLTVRSRDGTTVRLSAAYGAPSYLVTLADGMLEIGYEASSQQDWVRSLGAVRFQGEASIAAAFGSFQERRLVAFQIRHETKTGSTTSWVVFRRAETGMEGQVFVVPSPDGVVGQVMALREQRRLKRKPAATAPPPPVPPPPKVVGTGDAATGGGASVIAEQLPCESQGDCPAGQVCQSPEQASWNACGQPRPSTCADGFIGDSCGHCFRSCRRDEDCTGGHRCNGAGGQGYCISAGRCGAVRKIP